MTLQGLSQATELSCNRSFEWCNGRLVVKHPFCSLMQSQSRTMKSRKLLPLSPTPSPSFSALFFLPMCTPSTQLYSYLSQSVVLTLTFFFLQNCCVSNFGESLQKRAAKTHTRSRHKSIHRTKSPQKQIGGSSRVISALVVVAKISSPYNT